MKWFIIFVITCAYGYKLYDPTAVDPLCAPDVERTKVELMQCFNFDRFDSNNAKSEVFGALFQHNGDANNVRPLAVKYCKIGYELLDCSPIYFNLTEACQPVNPTLVQSFLRAFKRTFDFTCENEAEAFVQLIITDGIKLVMENEVTASQCAQKMNSTEPFIKENNVFIINPLYCLSIRDSLKCHLEWMQPLGNTHLINFMNGSYIVAAEEFGC